MAAFVFLLIFGGMGVGGVLRRQAADGRHQCRVGSRRPDPGASYAPWSMTSRPDLSGTVDGLGVGSRSSSAAAATTSRATPSSGWPTPTPVSTSGSDRRPRSTGWASGSASRTSRSATRSSTTRSSSAGIRPRSPGWLTESRRLAILRLAQGFPGVRIGRSTGRVGTAQRHHRRRRVAPHPAPAGQCDPSARRFGPRPAGGRSLVRSGAAGSARRRDRPVGPGRTARRRRAPPDGRRVDGRRRPRPPRQRRCSTS